MSEIRIERNDHDIEVREYFGDTYIVRGSWHEISNDWAYTHAHELKVKLDKQLENTK
jgi:phage protein D